MFHPSSRSFCWWVNPPYSNISKCHVVVRMSCLMLHDISQYISIIFFFNASERQTPALRSLRRPRREVPTMWCRRRPWWTSFWPTRGRFRSDWDHDAPPMVTPPQQIPSSNMGLCSNPWKSLLTKWEFQRFQLGKSWN